MNIYSQKQSWKIILIVAAMVIVSGSLWYTNILVKKIATEERTKVRLWAEAIKKKAVLVKYTNELFQKLGSEERKKVELWAEATRQLANANQLTDYTFVLKVVADNTTVPVILADEKGQIISHRNLDPERSKEKKFLEQQKTEMAQSREPIEITVYGTKKNYLYYKDSKLFSELRSNLEDIIKSFISEIVINSASVPVIFTDQDKSTVIATGNVKPEIAENSFRLKNEIAEMEMQNPPIEIDIGGGEKNYIFYKESLLLTQLRYYPLAQFIIIGLFIFIAYWLFSIARKAEQNQVWVGMAKETAHQLGTPLSSLIAWMELLKDKVDEQITREINKDISRLETITERFSKIGSAPKLVNENVAGVIEKSVDYIKSRSPEKVEFRVVSKSNEVVAKLNIPLFEWVIENLCKNAIDAMNGEGKITIEISDQMQYVYIDVTDTGKGIPKSRYKTVFEPGFTTKKRGWGLGLSLSKRIIENYHSGKIFVKRSEADKGTTFRIVLNK